MKPIFIIFLSGFLLLSACSSNSVEPENASPAGGGEKSRAADDSVYKTEKKPDFIIPKRLPVNRKTLSLALKNRLKNDKAKVLTEKDWEQDEWQNLKLGIFYKNDDEFIRDTVCVVTLEMLKPNNEKLTRVSQRKLRRSVNFNTKGKDAVNEMLDASLDTEPIEMIP